MADLSELLEELKHAAGLERWRRGRDAAQRTLPRLLRDEGDEFELAVPFGRRSFRVTLWPSEAEWECTCPAGSDGCIHAVAAAVALEQRGATEEAAPAPRLVFHLGVAHAALWLALSSRVGEEPPQPLTEPIPRDLVFNADEDELLRKWRAWPKALPSGVTGPGRLLPGGAREKVIALLAASDEVFVDEHKVTARGTPLAPWVVARDEGAGFRLHLKWPVPLRQTLPGRPRWGVLEGSHGLELRPLTRGGLSALQLDQLRRGARYRLEEQARLVTEILPAIEAVTTLLRETERLPRADGAVRPRLLVSARREGHTLILRPRLVYGDPPVAELRGSRLRPLGGLSQLPSRDPRGEERLLSALREELGARPREEIRLEGDRAVGFLGERVPTLPDWRFEGSKALAWFTPQAAELTPSISRDSHGLKVEFAGDGRRASAVAVLAAFRRGASTVPLLGGGQAAVPAAWLARCRDLLAELVAAREERSSLSPVATAALLDALDAPLGSDEWRELDSLRRGGSIPARPAPTGVEAKLRDYQLDGFRWLAELGARGLGAILADDMGLGKTLQALTLIQSRRGAGPALAVVPTSVRTNWLREAARFTPGLRCAALHGPRRQRVWDRLDELDLVVTSYGVLRQDRARFADREWSLVILDEAQAIKNPDSLTARAARSLRAQQRVALSGTPIENHLGELWSLMAFLNRGLLGTRSDFDERYAGPLRRGETGVAEQLAGRVRPLVLRRLKSEVARELPERVEILLHCPMSRDQQLAYRALSNPPQVAELQGGNKLKVLELLTRLRQVCCHPGLLPGGQGESGKLTVFLRQLEQSLDGGHRALVFSQFTSLLDLVEPELQARGIGFLRLDGSTRNRQALVDRFQAEDGPPVFLISLKAGGTGLNLTAADHVYHLDPWWNPAAEDQATDRAHRIGQTRRVVSYKLVSEGTVEERIVALQQSKRALASAIIGQGVSLTDLLADQDLSDLVAPGWE